MSEPKPVKRKRQSENEEGGRKRRRFNKSNEPNKKFPLPTFARSGIICTCDQNNRIRCGWEARTILQEEFERKFGEFCPVQYNVAHPSISDASESISDMLNKELNDQKGGVSISNPKERLWEFTTTKCKGIEYLEIQPKGQEMMGNMKMSQFLTEIFIHSRIIQQSSSSSLQSSSFPTQQSIYNRSRYIRRMIPIDLTCHSDYTTMGVGIRKLSEQYIKDIVIQRGLPFKFKMEFKARSNSSIQFQPVVDLIKGSLLQLADQLLKKDNKTQEIEKIENEKYIQVQNDNEKNDNGDQQNEEQIDQINNDSSIIKTLILLNWANAEFIFFIEVFGNVCGMTLIENDQWQRAGRWSFSLPQTHPVQQEGSDKKDVDIKMDVKTDNLIERNKDVESQDDDVEEEEEEDDEEVGEDQFVSQVQKGKTDDE